MQQFKSLTDPKLIKLLNEGGVGVLPTDTIYGLLGRADNEASTQRLYALKSRAQKPGTIIAANTDQLEALGIRKRYIKAVEQFWPGPVSVIIPAESNLQYLHLGKFSLGCRIPKHPQLQKLLAKTGPLVTTSANHPNKEPANTVSEAEKYFGDRVDFYVDGGDLHNHQPSTIVRIIDDAVEVLREGAVKIDEASGQIIS